MKYLKIFLWFKSLFLRIRARYAQANSSVANSLAIAEESLAAHKRQLESIAAIKSELDARPDLRTLIQSQHAAYQRIAADLAEIKSAIKNHKS